MNIINKQLPHPQTGRLSLILSLGLTLFTIMSGFAQTNQKEVVHSVYVTSNTGLRSNEDNKKLLDQIVRSSQTNESNSLVMVGNIVPETGFPDKDNGRKQVEDNLKEHLLNNIKDFNGKIIYTPGYNEWQEDAPDNIDDLESFLQDTLESEFWPSDGCPIESKSLSDDIQLIMIDSQWYVENWDEHPYINNKCEIKTRLQFLDEFNDELEDSQRKTVLVAVHHPVMTQTKIGFFEKMIGYGTQTSRNPQLKELMGSLEALARQYNDVIFLSGKDRNLQYVQDDGVEQVIAGITAESSKARPDKENGDFVNYELGYAKINIYKNGASNVEFFNITPQGETKIFEQEIARERPTLADVSWPDNRLGKTTSTSVYTKEETDKDGLYKALWGEHYRPLYSKEFEFPVLYLDTLPGNLKVLGAGGGHQSRSLGFIDEDGHEYTLRALRKSAIQFLQTTVITNHFVEDYLENTVAERYVQDFYTTAFPYGTFPAGEFMDELDIMHPNAELYYVPKQEALGVYNEEYGNELYMFEAHIGDENSNLPIFDGAKDILNTPDLFQEMQESKEASVDEEKYIRSRLLDMFLGDWDRHEGQYEWAEFEGEAGKKKYLPIAKDRDQVFAKTDGLILSLLRVGFPQIRAMEPFTETVKRPQWFNLAGYPLDKAVIRDNDWNTWKEQAEYLQNTLTDEVIQDAFDVLPADVASNEYVDDIKNTLKIRRGNMLEIAREYYEYLVKFDVFVGTEKDDSFLITRMEDGITQVDLKNKDNETIAQKTYNSDETNEVWIYGLDGDDEFKIVGEGSSLVKLKVLGGEENDIYDFQNDKRAKLYDYKSKKNTIKTPGASKMLVDSYEINNYDPKKRKSNQYTFFPSANFNSDQGFSLGVKNTFTTYGLVRNPFTTQHNLSANYYFTTKGFDVGYYGEFSNIFYKWNFGLDAYYSSPNYVINYFGTGNETEYDSDDVSKDYNRVKIEQWRLAPSIIYRKNDNVFFSAKGIIESKQVSYDQNRIVGETFTEDNDVFEQQLYAGGELNYNYFNKDRVAFPSRGIELDLTAGYKANIDEYDNKFAYVRPMLSLNYPLHESGFAAIATKIGGEAIFGDDYEFYHAATLGGGNRNTLRGYRNERFNGKYAFYQNIDIRSGITQFRTNFIPIRLGASVGYDYGRVWVDEDDSNEWHSNVGGSIFINAFKAFTGNIGYYVGDEGGRLNFTVNFDF